MSIKEMFKNIHVMEGFEVIVQDKNNNEIARFDEPDDILTYEKADQECSIIIDSGEIIVSLEGN